MLFYCGTPWAFHIGIFHRERILSDVYRIETLIGILCIIIQSEQNIRDRPRTSSFFQYLEEDTEMITHHNIYPLYQGKNAIHSLGYLNLVERLR